MSDFLTAKHTAVISDLHLCEAQEVNPIFPLWKKYKTRQYFFDEVFQRFLLHIEEKSRGDSVELVLNGDIFDFDSVLKLPDQPLFRVNWLESLRGLKPRSERSQFKIKVILEDHAIFVNALREFILRGNRAVFVIGNHDLELHFKEVQNEIFSQLNLPQRFRDNIRFVEWFYISNQDTLIEHGNQYDPYCVCEDPINPFIRGYNYLSLRLPFGNLACRYIVNGMGFFNPHVDSNYIMTLKDYVYFFLKYMIRAQPGLMFTWFWGSVVTLFHASLDRLKDPVRNPLNIEDRIQVIAVKANAEPRMVRELKELFAIPASSNPWLLAQELWLDRAFLFLVAIFVVFEIMIFIKTFVEISYLWVILPLLTFFPFFMMYSKSVGSMVSSFKEPDDRILAMTSAIAKVNRIIYGHTHIVRHELIGSVEHLNSGCWSPAFLDVECTKPIDQKTYVWISAEKESKERRKAEIFKFENNHSTIVKSP